jgi:uncharacterized protein (DUF305 family)
MGVDHRHDDRAARVLPLEALALRRGAPLALAAALLAGCGGHAAAPATKPTTTTRPAGVTAKRGSAAKPKPASPADVRFLRLLSAYDREDEVGATLAARKAASPQLHAAAMRAAHEASAELAAAGRLLAAAHERANGTPASLRRAWGAAYQSLLANAGSPFDSVYAPLAEQRATTELGLARDELRRGSSARVKALARHIVANRAADVRALRSA